MPHATEKEVRRLFEQMILVSSEVKTNPPRVALGSAAVRLGLGACPRIPPTQGKQMERVMVVKEHDKTLPTVSAGARPVVAAEPARLAAGEAPGVLCERPGGLVGFVGDLGGV